MFPDSTAACSGDITITTSDDSGSIADCDAFDGNILISSDAAGSLEINGLGALTGDLTAKNASQLTSTSADALSSVGGALDFSSCSNLSALHFRELADVNAIKLMSLPALQSLEIGTGLSRSNDVQISNTGLTSTDEINLEAVGALNMNNNRNLTCIEINRLRNVTKSVTMAANNPGLAVSFPSLATAANLTIFNISSLSIPSLIDVSGSLSIYSSFMDSLSAPNITKVGKDLSLLTNARLLSLDLAQLQTIGGPYHCRQHEPQDHRQVGES